MHNFHILVKVLLMKVISSLLSPPCSAQQSYAGNAVLHCGRGDHPGPSPTILYTCNGRCRSCPSFLTFKSQPPYDSVPTIAALMSSDVDGLARANNATKLTVFPANMEVIVPVNCSCSGMYYEAWTTYPMAHVDHTNDKSSYFGLANGTFQGLSTCESLMMFNRDVGMDLVRGRMLRVPLRCACPTRNETHKGTRYLLTYSISWNDTLSKIAERFGVSVEVVIEANGFSELNPTIYPFTTIIIPLSTPPSSLKTIQEYQPRPADSPPTKLKLKKKLCWAVRISAIFGVVSLTGIFSACFVWGRKIKSTILPIRCEKKRKLFLPADIRVEIASLKEVLKQFNYEEVQKATQNFSSRNIIGGSVYCGLFGRELLAVKMVVRDASKEVRILKKLNHFNLIRLKGFCQFENCSYLMFEYMSNGSLKQWLSNDKSKRIESWGQRIRIALDIANGLHYLHSLTKPGYVHKDINSNNILLNCDLRAKITNFGLARATDEPSVTSTPKIDVYAFGVMMLELVSGKGSKFERDGKLVLLSGEFGETMKEDVVETEFRRLIDPRLEQVGMEVVVRVAKLSVMCLAEERPTMEEIVAALVKIQGALHPPPPRPLELESFDDSSIVGGR